MSRGIGAYARKIKEDKSMIIYEYGTYNLNDPRYRNEEHLYDGLISIEKSCLEMSNSLSLKEALQHAKISVENSSNCWNRNVISNDWHIDVMACHILSYIFRSHQQNGTFPERISYNV